MHGADSLSLAAAAAAATDICQQQFRFIASDAEYIPRHGEYLFIFIVLTGILLIDE